MSSTPALVSLAVLALSCSVSSQSTIFEYSAAVERDDLFEVCPLDLIACVCSNSYMEHDDIGDNVPSETLKALTKGWMGKLPDSTKAYRMSIPGTHDSGAEAPEAVGVATQTWNIQEQLEAGIRWFDIRIKDNEKGDDWDIYHGNADLELSFQQVVNWVNSFLTANPTEFVVLHMQSANQGDIPQYHDISSDYFARYSALFERELWKSDPSLGDLRGKALFVFFVDPAIKSSMCIQNRYSVWRPIEGVIPYDGTCANAERCSSDCYRNGKVCISRFLGGGCAGTTLERKKELVIENIDKAEQNALNRWHVTYASGAYGMTPPCVASYTNEVVFDHLNMKAGKTSVGTVLMNFPGEGLIYRIIKSNFLFTKRVDYSIRIDCGSRAYGESQDTVTVTFYNGNDRLGVINNTPQYCNGGLDTEYNLAFVIHSRGQENDVTHVVVETSGTDDLFIDRVRLSVKKFGQP